MTLAFADIAAAASRLEGVAVKTPLISSPVLDERTGARVFVKAECLQRTGSFKFRGAYNRLSLIAPADRARGVVACSSGNHAQGIAEAARLFGMTATIVMPTDAPAVKRTRTERAGAAVVVYDRESEDRDAIAAEIVARTGATFVHPYDDFAVMAGQATAGLEAADELLSRGLGIDRVLVPVSGGGLIAGVATAVTERFPAAVVQPCEPEGFDDLSRSLAAGERVKNAQRTGTIADALMANTPGQNTFDVHRRLVRPGFAVSDAALLRAMAFLFEELKLVAEPGGCAGIAALLEGGVAAAGETVVVILSGGNVDRAMFSHALAT